MLQNQISLWLADEIYILINWEFNERSIMIMSFIAVVKSLIIVTLKNIWISRKLHVDDTFKIDYLRTKNAIHQSFHVQIFHFVQNAFTSTKQRNRLHLFLMSSFSWCCLKEIRKWKNSLTKVSLNTTKTWSMKIKASIIIWEQNNKHDSFNTLEILNSFLW